MTNLERAKSILDTQCADGNWNYDSYMHGMANGMICLMSILENSEPKYLTAPKVWLRDVSSKKIGMRPIKCKKVKKCLK